VLLALPVVIFNQTKSREFKSMTVAAEAAVAKLVEEQLIEVDKFDFKQQNTHVIFDLFTNRLKGAQIKDEDLPDNTILTSSKNFGRVVGPVFKSTQSIFDLLEAEET